MMATVTGLPATTMARAVGLDMALLALLIPFFLVVVMVGFRKTREVVPAALLSMAVLRIGPATGLRVFLATFRQLRFVLVTLA